MPTEYVRLADFEKYKESTTDILVAMQRDIMDIRSAVSEHSVRLSNIETQLVMMNARMTGTEAKLNGIEAQLKEVRHMLGFLITKMGYILPAMPEE